MSEMSSLVNRFHSVKWLHIAMFFILGVTAACGLMYEYMLSSYAARVLGSMEKVIFTVILLMILAMGAGAAWIPRIVKNNYYGFALIESLITISGSLSIVLVSVSHGFGYILPQIIAETYNIPVSEIGGYGVINILKEIISFTPYLMAIIIGLLVGAEIPLMAEIRQDQSSESLTNNTGTMYGVDYVGAFFGGMLWIYYLCSIQISASAVVIASTNLLVGILFIVIFRKNITKWKTLLIMNILAVSSVIFVFNYGWDVERWSEQLLYKDKIVFSKNTEYQRFVITKRDFDEESPEYRVYINGNTQFSSSDEGIYHSMLVTPAMLAAKSHSRVLVVGGGDGLAVRNILRWNPESVTLLDLDHEFIGFFKSPYVVDYKAVNLPLLEMNEYSFSDKRVNFVFGDAYLTADQLIQDGEVFDVIIIDLPDPNHPALAKLYSTVFYDKMKFLLSDEGVIVAQSTSPYNAHETFMSIKKTMEHHVFEKVEQYHVNVPSFGEWGFTIAKKDGTSPKKAIEAASTQYPDDFFTTKDFVLSAFNFGKNFYANYDNIEVNYVDSLAIYNYHQKNWYKFMGTFRTDSVSQESK